MKKVKIILSLALACLTIIALALPVSADMIMGPRNDEFYKEHQDECEYAGSHQHMINTKKGHAFLYASPESDIVIKEYSNGETEGIFYYYTDENGEIWGLTLDETGWFRMSDLTLIYDSNLFIEEHEEELKEYVDGSYTIPATKEKPVLLWKYPGALSEKKIEDSDDVTKRIYTIYTDENGVVWGFKHFKNAWVCLSSPYDDSAKDTSGKYDVVLKADPTPKDEIPTDWGNLGTLILVGILVGGVVLVTAVIIIVMFAANKKKKAEQTVKI